MRLIISVMGPAKDEIENLINSAIGERIVHRDTDYEFDKDDSFFTVTTVNETDATNLANYIWSWLPRKDKMHSTVRFFKKRGDGPARPSFNMLVLSSMLKGWG